MSFAPQIQPTDTEGTDLPPVLEKTKKSTDALGVSAAQFASAMTKAFTQATTGGKQFDDVLKNMALKLSSMAVTNAFKPLAKSISKGLGNGLKDILNGTSSGGGGDSGDNSSNDDGKPPPTFARGGIKPFASGGVIGAPTYFPLSTGGLGLAGEAGPEAIVPLSRGPGGRLGVAMSGAQGGNVTVQIITPDASSFRRSESYLTGQIARAVSRGQRSL